MIKYVEDIFYINEVAYKSVSVFADALYVKYYQNSNIKPLTQTYRFVANGMNYTVDNLESVLHYIIFDYQTFEIVYEKDYSEVEIDLISNLIKYQIDVGAKTKPIKNHTVVIDYNKLTNIEKKDKLSKIFKGTENTGIVYIPNIDMYTSSTLFHNPNMELNTTTNRFNKTRYVGDLMSVVLKTLNIYNNYKNYRIPISVNAQRLELNNFREFLGLVINNTDFEYINDRYYFSSQQKHLTKYLQLLGGEKI